jgi:hypothetical protein
MLVLLAVITCLTVAVQKKARKEDMSGHRKASAIANPPR